MPDRPPETPSEELLEERLREAPLGEPCPTVRARLLSRARKRQARQRRQGWVQWALTAAAGLLVATNLAFGLVHERRMATLTGGPTVERTVAWADISLQRRELSMLLLNGEQRESRWQDD